MESGNSGSLQSSSGAEEECESRAAVQESGNFITATNNHQLPPPSFNHPIFDHNQINNINPFFFTPSPQNQQLFNLDSASWSKTLPSFSEHHFTTTTTTEPNPPAPPPKNPKKRSRASRRAPTTVLTTDTSNFRAMVQEFTGIPAPPFTSSSSTVFPRLTTSFDLFGRPSPSPTTSTTMMRSNNISNNFDNLPQLHSYLIRPYSHKLQSLSSSSSSSSLLDSSNLLNTMQNTIMLPSSSVNQSLFLNPKPTQNITSSHGFSVIGQNLVHEQIPSRNESQGNETSSMKGDQEFIEPWGCSSD